MKEEHTQHIDGRYYDLDCPDCLIEMRSSREVLEKVYKQMEKEKPHAPSPP